MESNHLILAFLVVLAGLCETSEEVIDVAPELEFNETIERQWNLITTETVEDQCLKQARDAADEEGVPSYLVYGCDCDESESNLTKEFDCYVRVSYARSRCNS